MPLMNKSTLRLATQAVATINLKGSNFFEEILKIVKPNPIFVGIYSDGT